MTPVFKILLSFTADNVHPKNLGRMLISFLLSLGKGRVDEIKNF